MARNITALNRPFIRQLINQHLQVSRNHLTPELALYLITPKSFLWKAQPDQCPFDDPFWAFYWPGGQALTRFVLDQPRIVENKYILDLGCGCGSVSIAAKMSKAKHVLANDIDPIAVIATEMNMEMNSCVVDTATKNFLKDRESKHFDVVFIGDMFYDLSFASMISSWVHKLPSNTTVFIGDPGRLAFNSNSLKESLRCVAQYEMSDSCRKENNGLTHTAVWQLIRK